MDELDKRLYNLYNQLDSDIKIPNKCDIIIKEGLNNSKTNKKVQKYLFTKTMIATCASLILTAGIVSAGVVVSNQIWKEPEKTVGFDYDNNQEVINNNTLSEEEARKKAEEILEKFGYKSEKIKEISITNNPSNYDSTWNIKTENGIKISFYASNPEDFSLWIDSVLDGNIQNYRTTEKEAEKTARKFFEQYGYDLDKYNYMKITSNLNTEKESYIWNVDFYKKYDDYVNIYEHIGISFIPEINQLYQFSITNIEFENASVEITEEQAKEIVLNEEKKIKTKYEIDNIDLEMGIVSMNGLAYLRINDYEQFCKQHTVTYPAQQMVNYRTEKHVRKAWIVTVTYNIPNSVDRFSENFNAINDQNFSYYVDATTGEIIGGCINYKIFKRVII